VSRDEFDDRVTTVAALGEPIRRALYRYVVAQDGPVSREQAAAGAGVAHHVAKFHLDKLEGDGLLDVEYSRPAGRTGPGAGRPAKLYRRSSREIEVSLPERRYDLVGDVMARAITTAQHAGVPVTDAVRESARAVGQRLGEQAKHKAAGRRTRAAVASAVSEVLADQGYEPRSTSKGITLANCPFHRLADTYTDLVCGMNLDLVTGLLEVVAPEKLHARLDPAPGRCCVTVDKR
jgi:predicted ArsR family transcriptional regulator